jgi:hypothetical protein
MRLASCLLVGLYAALAPQRLNAQTGCGVRVRLADDAPDETSAHAMPLPVLIPVYSTTPAAERLTREVRVQQRLVWRVQQRRAEDAQQQNVVSLLLSRSCWQLRRYFRSVRTFADGNLVA